MLLPLILAAYSHVGIITVLKCSTEESPGMVHERCPKVQLCARWKECLAKHIPAYVLLRIYPNVQKFGFLSLEGNGFLP
jgi:hypothetical protein